MPPEHAPEPQSRARGLVRSVRARWAVGCALSSTIGGLLVLYGKGAVQILGGAMVVLGAGPLALLIGPVLFVVFVTLSAAHLSDKAVLTVPVAIVLFALPGIAWGVVLSELTAALRGRRAARHNSA